MAKKLSGLFDNIAKQNEDLTKDEAIDFSDDKISVLSQYTFSFGVDYETENYLKEQTYKVHKIANKMYDELGKIFKETQERLANNKNGVFYAWFTELGFNKNQVYRWINRYEFILSQNETIKNLIKNIPVTLSYEISNPNCPEILRNKVLNGEIKTLAEFTSEKNIKISHTEEVEIAEIVDEKDYISIFEDDLKKFNKYSRDFNYKLKTKLKTLSTEKQKNIVEEIEILTKKMEKLISDL